MLPKNNNTQSKQAWVTIGDKRFYARSKWEANYARFLEFCKTHKLIKDWTHEPRTWWFDGIKRGVNSYKPDFEVFLNDGGFEVHEVKGYMDGKSATKIKRMKTYFPLVVLKVVGPDWFKLNNSKYKSLIKDWA